MRAAPVAEITLRGNRRLANPSNPRRGGVYVLEVIQDGTGNRTLSYGNAYNFGEEGAPVLSGTAGESDIMAFFYNGNEMKMVNFAKGF